MPSYWSGTSFYFLLSRVKGQIYVAADIVSRITTWRPPTTVQVFTKLVRTLVQKHALPSLEITHSCSSGQALARTLGAPILCSVDGHISILRVAMGFLRLADKETVCSFSCFFLWSCSPLASSTHRLLPQPCCSCCRTRHPSIHSFSGPKGRVQVCAGGGQSRTRAGHYAFQRQNEARMTNERSQHCRSFPAQRPHGFLCEMVILCTFIGVMLHTYHSFNSHKSIPPWPH